MSRTLLLVAHAPSPNLQRLRDGMAQAAGSTDLGDFTVRIRSPFEADAQAVMDAAGVLLLTPENLGYMSGAMKDFFDRCYDPLLERTQGLPCAVVIRAGHDGTGTRRALEGILTGLRWKQVQPALVCRGPWQDAFIEQARTQAMTLAAGLDAGLW